MRAIRGGARKLLSSNGSNGQKLLDPPDPEMAGASRFMLLDLPDELIMILTPPQSFVVAGERLDGGECISNKDMAGAALALMILFSIFVQAAEVRVRVRVGQP